MTETSVKEIKWTSEALVEDPFGRLYNAFLRDSYNALVIFHNGDRVVVVLPAGAAQKSSSYWEKLVIQHAREAKAKGEPFVEVAL